MIGNEINLDFGREERIGFDEAIFAQSKSPEQLVEILRQAAAREKSLLLTRLSSEQLAQLPEWQRQSLDYDADSRTGYFGSVPPAKKLTRTAVVTAGSSDVPVGREAVRTLHYYGESALTVTDVGVAGIWRLLKRLDEIRAMAVVIVIAGMDGALPSVVGGLVPGVVIAVPTSVGYGVAEGGRTALHSALASCAPGLLVVNVDNGFGAACAALRVLRATGAR